MKKKPTKRNKKIVFPSATKTWGKIKAAVLFTGKGRPVAVQKPTKPAKKRANAKNSEAAFLWHRVGCEWKKLGRAKPGSFELTPKASRP